MSEKPTSAISDVNMTFIIDQHKELREEIGRLIKQLQQNEAAALLSSAAIWSWLASQQWKQGFIIVLFIPSALSLLFFLRWIAIEAGVFSIAKFLRKSEGVLNVDEYAWECHIHAHRTPWFRVAQCCFWIFLLTGDATIGFLFPRP